MWSSVLAGLSDASGSFLQGFYLAQRTESSGERSLRELAGSLHNRVRRPVQRGLSCGSPGSGSLCPDAVLQFWPPAHDAVVAAQVDHRADSPEIRGRIDDRGTVFFEDPRSRSPRGPGSASRELRRAPPPGRTLAPSLPFSGCHSLRSKAGERPSRGRPTRRTGIPSYS